MSIYYNNITYCATAAALSYNIHSMLVNEFHAHISGVVCGVFFIIYSLLNK